MKKSQWFALQIMFLVLMLLLVYMDLGNSVIYTGYGTELCAFEIHIAVFDAFMDMGIIISFFLSNVFMVLGLLEPKGGSN